MAPLASSPPWFLMRGSDSYVHKFPCDNSHAASGDKIKKTTFLGRVTNLTRGCHGRKNKSLLWLASPGLVRRNRWRRLRLGPPLGLAPPSCLSIPLLSPSLALSVTSPPLAASHSAANLPLAAAAAAAKSQIDRGGSTSQPTKPEALNQGWRLLGLVRLLVIAAATTTKKSPFLFIDTGAG